MSSSRPVVVGVDGSASSQRAAWWAAEEASRRGRPLELVHAYEVLRVAGQHALLESSQESAQTRAHALLESVAKDLDGFKGEVRLSPEQGLPAAVLLARSHHADLVVVGSRGHGELLSLMVGSTSLQVAMHASSPVVVVRIPEDGTNGPSAGRVVVGVDDSHLSDAAIAFAFDAAQSRRTGLTAVHTWTTPEQVQLVPTDVWAEAEQYHERLLASRMDEWRPKYPEVDIVLRVVRSDPARALVDESQGAALTVVGTRGRGGFAGLLLGSVSHGVLHLADSAVAVVRDGRVAAE